MKPTEVKSEVKSKMNNVGKNAKDTVQSTFDKTIESAPEMIAQVSALGKSFLESVTNSKDKMMETTLSSFQSLDKSIKSRPWAFVGGAVALGFVAGYLLGHRRPSSTLATSLKDGVEKIKGQIEQNINKVSEHLQ